MEPLAAPTLSANATKPLTLEEKYALLKEKVLDKRPILKQILERRGDKKLSEYVLDYVDINMNPAIPQRQHEMLNVVREIVTERFNMHMADEVVKQLTNYYFVSTADHTGPINHPFFLNSNLLVASALSNHPDPLLKYNIVFGCSNISVDNSSFPRGLFFHTYKNNTLSLQRLAFFSGNYRPPAVYTLPAYGEKEVQKIYTALKDYKKNGDITDAMYNKLYTFCKELYDTPELLACKNYAEQVSKTNYTLWKKIFTTNSAPAEKKFPDLLYLELEDIVVKLISRYHLYADTIINHILFDPAYEHYISTYFEDIFGSFSRKDSSGTYLFWAVPEGSRYNLQLWRKGNYLVSKDESYKIELTPEAIAEAMEKKEIIPGLLLNFMVVSFYYGLKCLGGFNQVNYLTMMKNGYIKMNVELENYRSIEVCARAQTKEMCDGLTVAFLGYNGGQTVLASGLDLYLYRNEAQLDILEDIIKNTTFSETFSPLLPEIYRITYDKNEWIDELLEIDEKKISELTGLNKKIKPCAFITEQNS